MYRIDSLLSARLFINPQLVGDRIYFLSNISGRLSLYVMDHGGSVPEPLLPPNLALQNPHLIGGESFTVFPEIGKILVMLDMDGDEVYRPVLIPVTGGYPEPVFDTELGKSRVHLELTDVDANMAYFDVESLEESVQHGFRTNLKTGEVVLLGSSTYGASPVAHSEDHTRTIIAEGYTQGDIVLFEVVEGSQEKRLVFGVPLDQRKPDQAIKLTGINSVNYASDHRSLLVSCAFFDDRYGAAYLPAGSSDLAEVKITGQQHNGTGELEGIHRLYGERYSLTYNIDGCTWMYEAEFDVQALTLKIDRVVIGKQAPLYNGMAFSYQYDARGDRYAVSFSSATSPTQIYSVEGVDRSQVVMHTREKVLGIAPGLLSDGEDASFTSFDGTRISARLYMPSSDLGFTGKRPLVYYIHGGPQGQERPDFAWFSMPLIQFLTLNGFAVFVPNVRGSTGYGLAYTKEVDRDWGGDDRLDHVHAMKLLGEDPRIDTRRAGVVGRSYGGYMTLTLVARHPELWAAGVDMFGPFDLLTFMDRIPETWKPYFRIALGDPETDREFLMDRSPRTHIDNLACPLLVIQGKNDPRVVARESVDLVNHLREQGKKVEYLQFDNEGHDVLKYENRVRCYEAITEFFSKYMKP